MNRTRFYCALGVVVWIGLVATEVAPCQTLPSTFDLRDVMGQNYITEVKSQQGGTCWTHGAMAAVESNMLITGVWSASGESGEPDLAEYHLDWWNGFNEFNNDDLDPPFGAGLEVHKGGDYRVTAAYLTRGEGAVRDIDAQSYSAPPLRTDPSYHSYYVRDIEWFTAGSDLSNIDTIKQRLMAEGALGTCMCYSSSFISADFVHYQPPSSSLNPNHAIAIIGWDDNKATQAAQPGAWLCKNSWGAGWGERGFFWISYYDKHCCKHPEMGAISFREVEPLSYDHIYYHDYHGWRDTKMDITQAFNAFTALGSQIGVEKLQAVSFFSAADGVDYQVRIYDTFAGGVLIDELGAKSGRIDYAGFHTIELDTEVLLAGNDDFYIFVELSAGGHPYDRTSDVPVLLGDSYRVIVESAAAPAESYYWSNGSWRDLYNFDSSANFCIKALSIEEPPLHFDFMDGFPEHFAPPGAPVPIELAISDGYDQFLAGTAKLHHRSDPTGVYAETPLVPLGGNRYEALLPAPTQGDQPQFYLSAETVGGVTATSPPGAPGAVHAFTAAALYPILHDDFESDLGWSVEDIAVATGTWERVDPVGTNYFFWGIHRAGIPAQPEDDNPAGKGTHCYITENQPPTGGGTGATDVDGGPTRLISPALDLTAGDALISYYYWYFNDDGNDPFEICLSNDDGQSWTPLFTVTRNAAWSYVSFKVSDYLTPTDRVRVRFSAIDEPNDSITEAGVDDFRVELAVLTPSLWADAYALSAADGAVIRLDLNAGVAFAHREYVVLGGFSGVYPGDTLPGGLVLPVNWDGLSDFIALHINGPAFQNFQADLDAGGQAVAVLDTRGPIDPGYIGRQISLAYTLPTSYDLVSNPVTISIEP